MDRLAVSAKHQRSHLPDVVQILDGTPQGADTKSRKQPHAKYNGPGRAPKKNPRQLPAGGSPSVSSLSGSEVTLSANVQEHGALVLELVHGGRLGSRSCQSGSARELLVEEERADFSRERQVLDGSPAGDDTNLGNVVVRVAAIVCRNSLAEVEARAELTLGREDVG